MQVLEGGLSHLIREFQGSHHINYVLENFDLAGSPYILQEGAQPEWSSWMVTAKDMVLLDEIKKNSTVYRQESGWVLKTIGLAHRNMKIRVWWAVLEKNKFKLFPILLVPVVASNLDLPATLVSGFLIT